MASFSSSFASTSFVTDAEFSFQFTGTPSVPLAVSVVSPLVFSSSAGYIKWSVTAVVGGEVMSSLTGEVLISGSEDAARLASFSVIPTSAAQLLAFESASVTLDITLFRTGQTATMRRFTGVVETVEFDPAARVATLHCRDGYQERPAACNTAAEVETLLGGLASPCQKIVAWNDDEPAPAAYFSSLLTTVPGACAIDSNGLWRTVPWSIGAAAATFGAGEVFSESLQFSMANRRDLPSAVRGTLNFRFYRLHCAEKTVTWDDPGYTEHLVYGLPILGRATAQQALEGLNGWLVKGTPVIEPPIPGAHAVIVGGVTQYYVIPYETAQTACEHLSATLYRRWYQSVQVSFSVDINLGGLSIREDSASASIVSSFDAAEWETVPDSETSLGLYIANPPTNPAPPSGYQGLPAPHPPANGAIDYYPDITGADLQAAARHVVALATRKAAAGKRKQAVKFARPIDPRWEIGAVLAVSAYGVTATGQLVAFEDRLDHDSGEAVSTLSLACPAGSGQTTSFSAAVTMPPNTVSHDLPMPALATHKGGWTSTPAVPIEDNLIGFLCNVTPTAAAADPDKPAYVAQFRIIMPEIPANVRDPISLDTSISAAVTIAGSGVSVSL